MINERDQEWAGKLAKSMGEGWGRHNSARDFRVRLGERSMRWIPRELGRFGQHSVREHWRHCDLGDVFPVASLPGVEGLYWQARSDRSSLRAAPFLFGPGQIAMTK